MVKFTSILFFALLPIFMYAQNYEYNDVEKTVHYYLEGGTNNDFETLKKAFHVDATMKFIGGEYKAVNALEFFEENIKPGPAQNRTCRVVSIDISGNAASAQLQIDYATFSFIDFMHLLKIDGEWKIVSKIFYRQVRAKKE